MDAIAEPHEPAVAHEAAERAEHLVLAAEIAELARQEHIAPPPGDPFPHPFAQCPPPRHGAIPACKNPTCDLCGNPTGFKMHPGCRAATG